MTRPSKRLLKAFLNTNIDLSALTATAAEINALDGNTSTAAELSILHGATATAAQVNLLETTAIATLLGAKNGSTVTLAAERVGSLYKMTFTLAATPIVCTDAAGSGSSGSVKIFDFVQGAVQVLGCNQEYTVITNASAQTTAAGNMAQVMGLGSVAANAGDGALTGTEVDFGSVTGTITSVANVGAGAKLSGAIGIVDGTVTASDLYLNWSGTAATSTTSGTTTVSGTVTLLVALLGINA